jgi:Cytochrome c554 and c-prime
MSKWKRRISLVLTAIFALGALTFLVPDGAFGQKSTTKSNDRPNDRKTLARKPATAGALRDRLGKDDGFGAVIFFSADVHGNLEVCGCPIRPLGGVARRMGYINAFRKRSLGAATVLVDAGYVFADDSAGDGDDLRADAVLMNDWIVRANEQMPLEMVNLSYRDLPYASKLLVPVTTSKGSKSQLISANIKASNDLHREPLPYFIKTLEAKRLKSPLKIAFIGLTDIPPDDQRAKLSAMGFTIEDPIAAAKTVLTEVADKVDVTVIVGYLKMTTANKIAAQNNDLDVIIASDGRGLIPDPKQVNNALIVYAAKETKHLGELRLYTDTEGIVDRFTARYVELDDVIPDDPAMAATTLRARREINNVQVRMAEAEASSHKVQGESKWVTSEKCASCHQQEYDIWKKSRHSHAFAALKEKNRLFDAACVGCHSVGYKQQGFVNLKATPQFTNVQCESCHGPAAEHLKVPAAGNYKTPATPASCIVCHDRDNSPDFVFDKYWPVVAHGKSLKKGD